MLNSLQEYISLLGLGERSAEFLGVIFLISLIIFAVYISYVIAKNILAKMFFGFLHKSNDNVLSSFREFKVVSRTALLAPALVLYFALPLILFYEYAFGDKFLDISQRLVLAYMVANVTLVIVSFLNALHNIYTGYELSKRWPIKTYIQFTKLVLFLLSTVLIISALFNKSPWGFITGLGAATALIVLIFKDVILGLTASLQVTFYDIVRISDRVTIGKYNADGIVEEISLSTVKIRNIDKTITTIATNDLLESGLKNWRWMQDSGGRIIKHALYIDILTIKFCTKEMLERFRKIDLIHNYLAENLKKDLPNVAVFRAYVNEYLKANKHIHQGDDKFIFLVRDLQPTKDTGLPIELCVFSKETDLVPFENVQADIIEHLLAALELFDLKALQH
jgi:miniconductance mechanosensitive channel